MSRGNRTLLSPAKCHPQREAVASSWARAGGAVLRLNRFWKPPQLDPATVCVYGGVIFSRTLANLLQLSLVSPAENLLPRLPSGLLKRRIQVTTLGALTSCEFPIFIKPVETKLFRGRVYEDAQDLYFECCGLSMTTQVMVSEVVRFESEARAFLLESSIQDCALYRGEGSLVEATRFVRKATRHIDLPDTCVIDVGKIDDRGWAIVEFNPTWAAALNGCKPDSILPSIAKATVARGLTWRRR